MSIDAEKTRQELLDLGLEDWIPVPEAVGAARAGQEDRIREVREVLTDLVQDGLVRLYRGPRDADEPAPVTTEEAVELLRDPYWYRFHLGEPSEERLYFVNVENIRES